MRRRKRKEEGNIYKHIKVKKRKLNKKSSHFESKTHDTHEEKKDSKNDGEKRREKT